MSERNEQVAAMLAADAPARHDLAFEVAVLASIEQRRFAREMGRNFVMAAGVALLLAFIMPQFDIEALAGSVDLALLTNNAMVMLGLLVAGFAAWYFRPVDA